MDDHMKHVAERMADRITVNNWTAQRAIKHLRSVGWLEEQAEAMVNHANKIIAERGNRNEKLSD